MSNVHPLAGLARAPGRNIFADVTHVDECGAPVLATDARPIPCENEMPASTRVVFYDAGGRFLTGGTLDFATRQLERGIVTRIGAAAFQMTPAADALRGRGLTPAQARRRYLADERVKAGL